MSFSGEVRGDAYNQLAWKDFEEAKQQVGTTGSISELVRCIQILLERFEESEFIKYLVIPSPSSLAHYFRLTVNEIDQALNDLNQLGYQTETSSHCAPITLWDPIIRGRTNRSSEKREKNYLSTLESLE